MQNYLKVSIDQGEDGTAGVLAEVHSGSFAGKSEAWFNLSEINKFIKQLSSFSKTLENPPHLKGGYWNEQGNLKEVLLSFRFYAFSSYRFGLEVILVEYPYSDCRKEEVSRVSVELQPESSKVVTFVEQLEKVINLQLKEAVLEC